ncbi:hypothetical protein M011DRAFT_266530 [Sporormia fimetaria CBS 119925]|uniref:Uncharacterized protein n=1 Tax=Sporormia fimetaria CBS 119925 TaxID=1340428 RepID=A0A6A6UY97_9PLEO|nr:hypothetical protein M011DRAFT_266530 [Sporormia fimetaria CBS 119925]
MPTAVSDVSQPLVIATASRAAPRRLLHPHSPSNRTPSSFRPPRRSRPRRSRLLRPARPLKYSLRPHLSRQLVLLLMSAMPMKGR